jgi:hypothetical protein
MQIIHDRPGVVERETRVELQPVGCDRYPGSLNHFSTLGCKAVARTVPGRTRDNWS